MERLFSFPGENGGKCSDLAAVSPFNKSSPEETAGQQVERGGRLSVLCGDIFTTRSLDPTTTSSCFGTEKAPSSALSLPQSLDWESCSEQHDQFELPTQTRRKLYRWLRWNFFSAYRRLFTIVFVTNFGVLVSLSVQTARRRPGLNRSGTITAASVNLAVSVLIRNEHMVNVLFLLSSSMHASTPLVLRCWLAKIYGYGGVHSGCATAAVAWYLGFTGLVIYDSCKAPLVDPAVAILTYANVFALLTITIFAHPFLRTRLHDWFECSHRFAGWIAISLFWAQAILIARSKSQRYTTSVAEAIISIPAFWCLILITLCIAYPWTRLRERSCDVEPLSPHAIRLHFSHAAVSHCSAIRLSTNPLKETHAFAAIPNSMGDKRGFSMVISNAGDWTSQIIKSPPRKFWIKGAPFYGVLRVAVMFKPVLIVATGSGIGPCLSLFHGAPGIDCRVLWSTPSPLETYGEEIMNDVLRADPSAIIVDTRKVGRPDLVRLTYEVFTSKRCEAVVVISNPSATRKVVYGMETRGVPAYGPIFDS